MASLIRYLRLGGEYALLSLFLTGALLLLLLLLTRKKRRPDRKTLIQWLVSLWYLCALLLGTLAGRWANRSAPFSYMSFRLFDALRRALVTTNRHEWSLLLLNVLVFVPVGLLLVWNAQGRKRGRRLYWAALLLPALIELLQLVTGLGFFEVDDLLLNALGGAWGLCLGEIAVRRRAHKPALLPALGALLPPAVLAVGLLWLSARPYGFVEQDFSDPSHGRPQQVSTEALEGELPQDVEVYRMLSPTKSEAERTVDSLLSALGQSRRPGRAGVYDDLSIYWAKESGDYVCYYAHTGDFILRIPQGIPLEGTAAETAVELLARAGLGLPEPSEKNEERIVWRFVPGDGLLYDGEILATAESGGLTRIDAKLRTFRPDGAFKALDAESVRQALLRGQFSLSEDTDCAEIGSLVCRSAGLAWVVDGKGCYHPVYQITCLIDGEEARILAPAIP